MTEDECTSVERQNASFSSSPEQRKGHHMNWSTRVVEELRTKEER
jgi:hypothetical protein